MKKKSMKKKVVELGKQQLSKVKGGLRAREEEALDGGTLNETTVTPSQMR